MRKLDQICAEIDSLYNDFHFLADTVKAKSLANIWTFQQDDGSTFTHEGSFLDIRNLVNVSSSVQNINKISVGDVVVWTKLVMSVPDSIKAFRNIPYTFTLSSNAQNPTYICNDSKFTINGNQATLYSTQIAAPYTVKFICIDESGFCVYKDIQVEICSDALTLELLSNSGAGTVDNPYVISLAASSPYKPINITCSDNSVVLPNSSSTVNDLINYTLVMKPSTVLTFTATDSNNQTATIQTNFLGSDS